MRDSDWCFLVLIMFFIGMYLFKKVGDGKIKFCSLDSLKDDNNGKYQNTEETRRLHYTETRMEKRNFREI